jgi:xanthine dehydrogenase YagR molybdenum-binding subunit
MTMAGLGIGSDVARIDGVDKVTGRARYTFDHHPSRLLHAALVPATVGKGRITQIDAAAAGRTPGVVAVITHENMERLQPSKFYMAGGHSFQSLQPLQNDHIAYRGQTIAIVLAETIEAANEAALLVETKYEVSPFNVEIEAEELEDLLQAEAIGLPIVADKVVGNADNAMSTAEVVIDERYETPAQHHNPIELISTLAEWDGDKLTAHVTTQGTEGVRQGLAIQLGIEPERIRIVAHLIGGSFGQKAALGAHTAIVAVAARLLDRPVKLEIPRSQIYHAASFRAATRQRVRIGANRDGRMIAAIQETRQQTSRHDLMPGLGTDVTSRLYGIPNFRGQESLVRLDTQTPGFMRAPFEMAGAFSFESAVDELAYKLGQDPLALRMLNDAKTDPITGKPFSSRWLKDCLSIGADQFGWSARSPAPCSMRAPDGTWIGMGVAIGAYKAATAPTAVRARLNADGSVEVSVAAHEMGQGISTAIYLAIADRLGVPPQAVRLKIGDTAAPPQHLTAGSWGTATAVPAVAAAADRIREQLIRYACETQGGYLYGVKASDVKLIDGRIVAPDGRSEQFSEILSRVDQSFIEEDMLRLAPGQNEQSWSRAQAGLSAPQGPVYPDFVAFTFAAHFAEVHINPRTRQIRVARMVSVIDCGKVVSLRMARSQALGGLVWGIGAALSEVSEIDPRFGGFLNADIAEYVVPVNADVRDLRVSFIDKPDPLISSIGAKGLGEITCVGSTAAIVNAIYHASGRRVRRIPVRIDDLFAS